MSVEEQTSSQVSDSKRRWTEEIRCGAVFDLYKGEKRYVPVEVKTHYDVVQLRKKSALDGRIDIDRYVHSLLNISQSAIRIKFVWRHLIQYRQDLLDEYLQSRKSYRGVFAMCVYHSQFNLHPSHSYAMK